MRTTAIVIGAGHAGLAMSRCLADHSIDHVVLERGEVANSWQTERWDSLRLLTPNWMSRLPDYGYEGDDPDGYRTMPQTIAFIRRYAEVIAAPVQTRVTVTSVRCNDAGYRVVTNQGDWQCRVVVLATGACNLPSIPAYADAIPSTVSTYTSIQYRNPSQTRGGGVLVVGASATGTQIADEIHRSGRPVTLAVGEHVRAPRVYRGRDIQWWMDATGIFDERYDEIDNLARARSLPSMQLVGSDDRRTVDLNSLTDIGVRLVGRLAGIKDGKAQFRGRCTTCARCPISRCIGCSTRSMHGRPIMAATTRSTHRNASSPPESQPRHRSVSISRTVRSGRSSGPLDTAPTMRGSTCPSSTTEAVSATTVGLSSPLACT